WEITFPNIKLIHCDFLNVSLNEEKPLVFFGNPPFVKNETNASKWKNMFADFLEKALVNTMQTGHIHLILPLSIAFSRDYTVLRKMLQEYNRKITFSHFDNIPDTLFKS